MYDYDSVEMANMNRLFFRPEHAGMTKTDAAAKTLAEINPDVIFESFGCNITSMGHFDKFMERIQFGGIDGQRHEARAVAIDVEQPGQQRDRRDPRECQGHGQGAEHRRAGVRQRCVCGGQSIRRR